MQKFVENLLFTRNRSLSSFATFVYFRMLTLSDDNSTVTRLDYSSRFFLCYGFQSHIGKVNFFLNVAGCCFEFQLCQFRLKFSVKKCKSEKTLH